MIASGKRRLRGLKNPAEFAKKPLACQAGPPEGGRVMEYPSPSLLFVVVVVVFLVLLFF